MAAVETLRRGYPRYIILGAGSENNVSVIQTAPTYATTTGTYSVYGNQVMGNSTTTYGGGGPIVLGTHDADLRVLMLREGDNGFEQGLDARMVLGEDWQKAVAEGISTCTG